MNEQERLGEEKISKLLLEFSIPAIIGMSVYTLYNIIDRIFIGHIKDIGEYAMAGVGVTMPIMLIILAFSLLIGVGSATKISIMLGESNKEEAEKLLGASFILIIITSIFLTVLGLIFINPLLTMFGASENSIGYGRDFAQIIIIGCIFSMISLGLNNIIRSDGNPTMAMLSTLVGTALNIIFEPIFIFGLGLGVKGAALGTVISQIICTIIILYYFTKGSSILKIKRQNLRLDKEIVLGILAVGVSPFSVELTQSAIQIVTNYSLQKYGGDLAVSAMTIISCVAMLFIMPTLGLNQGLQPIIGYNYGAKKYDRVKETVKNGIIVARVILTTGFIIIQLFSANIVAVFNSDIPLNEITSHGMKIFLFMFPIVSGSIIITNYFQSIGQAKISIFLSLLRQVIILIPCIIILPIFIGLDGVWIAGTTSDLIAVIITYLIFFKEIKKLSNDDVSDNKTIR